MAVVQQNAFISTMAVPNLVIRIGKPGSDMAAMEGRVGKSGSLHILIFSLASCQRWSATCALAQRVSRLALPSGIDKTDRARAAADC